MNCTECQENLVAGLEGLLRPEQTVQCRAHLESCPECRAEYAAMEGLQQELVSHGHRAADVSVVVPVMQEIRRKQFQSSVWTWEALKVRVFTRWGFGLSAIGAAAAVILVFGLTMPSAQAKAAQIMAKGAQAIGKLRTIHFRGQVRTLPVDNFSLIGPEFELVPIELWKQFDPDPRWRVEKSGRVAVMDGQSTLLYMKAPANVALKVAHPVAEAFDTDWLHRITDLSETLTEQLSKALAMNWKMSLATEQGTDGRAKSVVTLQAKAPVPDTDAFKNKFFDLSDTRQVYHFDKQTELLESMQAYLVTKSGEVLIFELTNIDYNPTLDQGVFRIELPPNLTWHESGTQNLPEREKSGSMSAQQAARAFFEACARGDWAQVQKFWPLPVDDSFKQYLGGLQLISLGDTSASALFGTAEVIPYEIKLKSGDVKKHALGLKKDGKTGGWYVDGGI
jgi:outer membrane lipoprotein-sorting protein